MTGAGAGRRPSAVSTLGEGGTTNYLASPPFSAPTIPADVFGEMSINLTQSLGAGGANPCFNFGTVWLHTYNGNSISSIMADYVAPKAVLGAASCAVSVDKKVAVNQDAVNAPADASDYHHGTPADPSSAQLGEYLWYRLAVTNSGTVAVTPNVTDANCDLPANPAPIEKKNSAASNDAHPGYVRRGRRLDVPLQAPARRRRPRALRQHGQGDRHKRLVHDARGAGHGEHEQQRLARRQEGLHRSVRRGRPRRPAGRRHRQGGERRRQRRDPRAAGQRRRVDQLRRGIHRRCCLGLHEQRVMRRHQGHAGTGDDTPVSSSFDAGTLSGSVTVAGRTAILCTITNARKAGTIKVVKDLDPTADAGPLQPQHRRRRRRTCRAPSPVTQNFGDGDMSAAVTVPTGNAHTVAEAGSASPATSLGELRVDAFRARRTAAPTSARRSATSMSSISVAQGDAVVCTFVNTAQGIADRRQGLHRAVRGRAQGHDQRPGHAAQRRRLGQRPVRRR